MLPPIIRSVSTRHCLSKMNEQMYEMQMKMSVFHFLVRHETIYKLNTNERLNYGVQHWRNNVTLLDGWMNEWMNEKKKKKKTDWTCGKRVAQLVSLQTLSVFGHCPRTEWLTDWHTMLRFGAMSETSFRVEVIFDRRMWAKVHQP